MKKSEKQETKLQTIFDLIDFAPLSWGEWKLKYGSNIRVVAHFNRLKKAPTCGLVLADRKTPMYIPWYSEGKDWRDGEPRQVTLGERLMLVRLPAFKLNDRYMIVDGIHRLTMLKPAIVLLDYVEIPHKDRLYFNDLMNEFWRKK